MREYESRQQDLAMLQLVTGLGKDESSDSNDRDRHVRQMQELDRRIEESGVVLRNREAKAQRKIRQGEQSVIRENCGQLLGKDSLEYVIRRSMPACATVEDVAKYVKLYDGLSTLMAEY